MIVLDTSIFTDFLVKFDENRHVMAKNILDILSEQDSVIFEPFLFDIELCGILRRRFDESKVLEIINILKDKVEIVEENELHKFAFDIALKTKCRAIDSYFIATAKLTNSILITNDKIMNENAKKYGIESYYLIEEYEKVEKRIKEMK